MREVVLKLIVDNLEEKIYHLQNLVVDNLECSYFKCKKGIIQMLVKKKSISIIFVIFFSFFVFSNPLSSYGNPIGAALVWIADKVGGFILEKVGEKIIVSINSDGKDNNKEDGNKIKFVINSDENNIIMSLAIPKEKFISLIDKKILDNSKTSVNNETEINNNTHNNSKKNIVDDFSWHLESSWITGKYIIFRIKAKNINDSIKLCINSRFTRKEVKCFVYSDFKFKKGEYVLEWDLKDKTGKKVPNGTYKAIIEGKEGQLKTLEKIEIFDK